jgi:hypothetical protein
MDTRFVELELTAVPAHEATAVIEAALRLQGEPLRWAIAAVEDDRWRIEAVVTGTAAATVASE